MKLSLSSVLQKIFLSLLIFFGLGNAAYAAESVTVPESADTISLGKTLMDMSMGSQMACMGELTKEMMARGMSAQQIGEAFDDPKKGPELEKKCACKNKPTIQKAISDAKVIIARNPTWNGKTLVIKSGTPQTGVSTTTLPTDFKDTESKLSTCP